MQAVGELDQDDPHVARHRQQHLAEIFRLRFFVGFKFDAVELGHAIDQFGHRLAELRGDFVLGDGGIFHHVVEQRRGQRLRVEVQLGEDVGDGQRVRNIRLTRGTELAEVCGFAEVIGGFKTCHVFRLQIAGPFLEIACSFRHGRFGCWGLIANH